MLAISSIRLTSHEFNHICVKALNKKIGASFCHVVKIKQLIQDKPAITLGSQKWNGKLPNFKSKPKTKRTSPGEDPSFNIISNSQLNDILKASSLPAITIPEPKACTIKYFIPDSVSCVIPR